MKKEHKELIHVKGRACLIPIKSLDRVIGHISDMRCVHKLWIESVSLYNLHENLYDKSKQNREETNLLA